MPGPRSDVRKTWIAEFKKEAEDRKMAGGSGKVIEMLDESTVEDGLKEKTSSEAKKEFTEKTMSGAYITAPGVNKKALAKKFKNQYEMRRFLQSATTEEEVLTMKLVLQRIAVDSGHKDCVKAIALLWAYVMGRPETDIRMDVNAPQQPLDEQERRSKVLDVMGKDRMFQDPAFRKRLMEVLGGETQGNETGGTNEPNGG